MMTYANLFRRQMWVLGIAAIVLSAVYVFLLGSELASIIIGWCVAVFWTGILLLEGCAFASERWHPGLLVARSTTRMSLIMMIVALAILVLPSVSPHQMIFESRMEMDVKGYYVDATFGGTYGAAVLQSAALVVCWGFLVGTGLGVRTMFTRPLPGTVSTSRWLKVLLLLFLFFAALTIPNAVWQVIKVWRDLSWNDWYDTKWRLNVLAPIQSVTFTLFLCAAVWSVVSWVRGSSTVHTLRVVILTAFTWLLPLAYGVIRYGPTMRHLYNMGRVYMAMTTFIPILLWGYHAILSRRTKSVELKG